MGKKDKKKNKGKGAEKTALKTEKKAINKIKKNLAAIGEDDLEKLISQCQEKNKKAIFSEELCEQPSPRSGFSLCAHPDKEELILFGGEFFNGSKTEMFDDLYFYNIKKNQWSILHSPIKPPPRCSHQAVTVAQSGGQMWVFGGEFASPSRSNFYHYRDLWVFHFLEKKWEQVKALGGPSPRSGHRMVVRKKQIVVFGGFHESLRDYRCFNDTFIFDLETYTWGKVEASGKVPSPRSGFQMAPTVDGRVLVYGGYFREKVKKDVDKGVTHTDMYYLQYDEKSLPPRWKWSQSKVSGLPPTPRCGMAAAVAPNNQAFFFGGVFDESPDELSIRGLFHNDLYLLDLDSGRWSPAVLRCKAGGVKKRRRRCKEGDAEEEEEMDEDTEEVLEGLQKTTLKDESKAGSNQEDSVFTVSVGPSTSKTPGAISAHHKDHFVPPARMNASAVVKNGLLYLYGGLLEDGDRQLTLSDFYALDIKKLDEWKVLVKFDVANSEWVESSEDEDDEEEEEGDQAMDQEETDSDEESSEED